MGIFKALSASLHGVSHNQYKKFFYCDSMPNDVLMVKATKKSNKTSADDVAENIIPDGSVVVVNEGQCAIFVSGGKVMEVCSEPGSHEISNPEAQTIMNGGKLKNTVKEVGRRFTYGGDAPAIDNRIYYVNTKLILANEMKVEYGVNINFCRANFGTTLTGHGVYSYRIVDPAIAYKQLVGDALHTFTVRYFNIAIADALSRHVKNLMYSSQGGQRETVPGEPEYDIHQYLLENFGIEINSLDFINHGISNIGGAIISNKHTSTANNRTENSWSGESGNAVGTTNTVESANSFESTNIAGSTNEEYNNDVSSEAVYENNLSSSAPDNSYVNNDKNEACNEEFIIDAFTDNTEVSYEHEDNNSFDAFQSEIITQNTDMRSIHRSSDAFPSGFGDKYKAAPDNNGLINDISGFVSNNYMDFSDDLSGETDEQYLRQSENSFVGMKFIEDIPQKEAVDPVSMLREDYCYKEGLKKQVRSVSSGSNFVKITEWRCNCGTQTKGRYCTECGQWRCSCGTQNKGKFCTECGQWLCSCGNICKGNFCSECGNQR